MTDMDAHLLRELWHDAESEVKAQSRRIDTLAASLEDARSEGARLRQKLLNLGYTPAEVLLIAQGLNTVYPTRPAFARS